MPLGKTTNLTGYPGLGKSILLCSIVASVTRGKPFPDGSENPLPPSEVMILSAEDDAASVLVPRLEAAGADLRKVHIIASRRFGIGDDVEETQVRLDEDCKKVQQAFRNSPNVRLFIVDPITNHAGKLKNNEEAQMRQLLLSIETGGVTNLIVTHLNKSTSVSALQRIMGAGAFAGLVRAAYLLAEDPDKNLHFTALKNNYARADGLRCAIVSVPIAIKGASVAVPQMKWLGKSDADADALLDVKAKLEAQRGATAKEEARDFLQEYLANGPKPMKECEEVAEQKYSISLSTLKRAKKELRVQSNKDGAEGPWMWSLPPTPPKPAFEFPKVR